MISSTRLRARRSRAAFMPARHGRFPTRRSATRSDCRWLSGLKNLAETSHIVMAGLVPAIHVLFVASKTWMPGTRPGMTLEMQCRALRRLLLRLNELAADQAFGDLDRVERGALAQIVGNDPHREPVLDRRILADAA